MTKHDFLNPNEPTRLHFIGLSVLFTAVPVVDDPNAFVTTDLSNKD